MRNFPWIEAFLIIALAIALIARPQPKNSVETTQPAIENTLGR